MKKQDTTTFNEQNREPSDSNWRRVAGWLLFLLAVGWW